MIPEAGEGATPGPLVSVVTPCLNPGERLGRCLESVAAQTYRRVEHLVVDGGSTDGTLARLEAANGIRWVSEQDQGQVQAINKGFGLAAGSILTWLNADDILLPETVEKAVAAFAADPALGFVFGDCRIVDGDGELLTWRPPRRLTFAVLEGGSAIPQPGSFLARSALDRIGPLDESFELAMDIDLWLRLLAAGAGNRKLNGVLSVFELHPGSKTGSVPRQRFYEENARAFSQAGRRGAAAHSLGQGAAAAAAVDGRVDRERLAVEVAAAEELAGTWQPRPPLRAIRAAAAAEAAVIELRVSLGGLRHLLVLDVWRDRMIRRRLGAAVKRGAPRVIRRLASRPRR